VVAAYARTGGRPPVDDERLEVLSDGTFRLWRTLGGERVGAFGGRLAADRRRRLDAAVAAARAEPAASLPPSRPRPDAARESFATGTRRLDVGSGTPVPGAWSGLVRLLRRWAVTLTASPVAALALEPSPSGGVPRLVQLGPQGVTLWPATLHVELYGRDRDGIVRDRASGGADPEAPAPRGDALAAGPGWAMELPVGRPPAVPAGGMLEVWALLDIEGPDGPVRARLTLAHPAPG